jgi:hypothetical protein
LDTLPGVFCKIHPSKKYQSPLEVVLRVNLVQCEETRGRWGWRVDCKGHQQNQPCEELMVYSRVSVKEMMVLWVA